jgi:cysteine-rich repeat protein
MILAIVALATVGLAATAHAGSIVAQGNNCVAMTDISEVGAIQGTAEYDEGPVNVNVPLETYAAQGLHFHSGALTQALAGVTTMGNASAPYYQAPGGNFPQPIAGGGTQVGQMAYYGGAATFDNVVTKVGLTAGQNGTQYLTAWDINGNMIGQVTWTPANDAAFIGIDCQNIPIGMVTYGNDDLWNGATYGIGGLTIMSDTWVWSGDTNCGNGMLDIGEECDDANADFEDDCTIGCNDASCGDGYVWAGMESCDDGNADNTDDCVDSCAPAACGDGFVWDGMEDCDDGNADNTDDCIDTCLEPSCGDGHVWAGMEECDDGNMDEEDSCLQTCEAAGCGDGMVQAGVEECDDGNMVATDGCTDACLLPICGDGIVREFLEDCDDGNMDETDDCAMCMNAACGDGFVHAGVEECDDGNDDDDDACLSDCTENAGAVDTGSDSGGADEGSSDEGGAGTGGEGTSGAGSTSEDGGGSDTIDNGFDTAGTNPATGCGCRSDRTAPASMLLGLVLLALRLDRRRAQVVRPRS